MIWRVEYAPDAIRDFELIFDHLYGAYVEFGETPDVARRRAADRVRIMQSDIARMGRSPFIGTPRPDILPDLRFVRRGRAVVWFLPDEPAQRLRVLAVFQGGRG